MALIKQVSIPVQGTDPVVLTAYCMVVAPSYNKLTQEARIPVVVWKDKTTREAFGAAYAAMLAAKAEFEAATAHRASFLPTGEETAEELAALEAATIPARAAENAAAATFNAAQAALDQIKPISQDAGVAIVGSAAIEVLTDGDIDIAKCYALLKTLAAYQASQDA